MAVSLTHTTVAAGTPAGDGEIAKDEWNEEHTLTLAASRLLGRHSGTAGAAEEISLGTGLSFSGGALTLDADLQAWAGVTPSANGQSLVSAADYAAMRTLLSLVPGTDVQAYDADLTTLGAGGSGARDFLGLGTGNTPTFTGVTLTGGTVTVSTPLIDATQTWNDSGVTFTGWKLNVTNTASGANSLLLDLQVGGASKFNVRKDGRVQGVAFYAVETAPTGGSSPLLDLTQTWSDNFSSRIAARINVINSPGNTAAVYFAVQDNGSNIMEVKRFGATTFGSQIVSGQGVTLAASSTAGCVTQNTGTTTQIYPRDGSNYSASVRNGSNACSFRVYRTWTDASNYERAALQSGSGYFELACETAGTGTDDIDLKLTPAGTGVVQFGSHSALGSETVTGYITIKDAAGNSRKLAVVS